MGNIMSEGLEYIGRIDDNGYIYNSCGDRFAQIQDSGYITAVAGWDTYGKIDEDGTIRDASMDVIGRIQADGYVYIHSKRVCKVSSEFIERITPKAWNAGQASTYNGRQTVYDTICDDTDSGRDYSFLFSPFFIKLVLGLILGIVAMVNGAGGLEMLLAGPVCVFLFSLIYHIFN